MGARLLGGGSWEGAGEGVASDRQEPGHDLPALAHEDVIGTAGRPRVHDLDADAPGQAPRQQGHGGEDLAGAGAEEDDLGVEFQQGVDVGLRQIGGHLGTPGGQEPPGGQDEPRDEELAIDEDAAWLIALDEVTVAWVRLGKFHVGNIPQPPLGRQGFRRVPSESLI